jgi:DNA-directed RNA polymerase
MFFKRKKIKINKKIMTLRINNQPFLFNFKKIKRGLLPNPIHAYDSSVLMIVTEWANELNINIGVIHDSIICNIEYFPIIKTLFKLANIKIIEKNNIEPAFPFKTIPNIDNFPIEQIKIEIIESPFILK